MFCFSCLASSSPGPSHASSSYLSNLDWIVRIVDIEEIKRVCEDTEESGVFAAGSFSRVHVFVPSKRHLYRRKEQNSATMKLSKKNRASEKGGGGGYRRKEEFEKGERVSDLIF